VPARSTTVVISNNSLKLKTKSKAEDKSTLTLCKAE